MASGLRPQATKSLTSIFSHTTGLLGEVFRICNGKDLYSVHSTVHLHLIATMDSLGGSISVNTLRIGSVTANHVTTSVKHTITAYADWP